MTTVVVPRKADGGHRDALWAHCRKWWQDNGFEVAEGHNDDELFSRSAAINAADHGTGDVFLIADSDVIPEDVSQIHAACERARETGGMVVAYDVVVRMHKRGTAQALHGEPITRDLAWPIREKDRRQYGGLIAVPTELFERLGGFDERFKGWGGEDLAFRSACATFAGVDRVPGDLFHLWHESAKPAAIQTPEWIENERLVTAYNDARGDTEAMQRMLNGSLPA